MVMHFQIMSLELKQSMEMKHETDDRTCSVCGKKVSLEIR